MVELQERLGSIAVIGGGQMGGAIVGGLIKGASFDVNGIVVAEPFESQRNMLSESYGVRCVEDGSELDRTDTIIMAVKPQIFRDVAAALVAAANFAPKRVVSIAAGITTALMTEYFTDCAVIRVMPNINLMVASGMSVVAPSDGTPLAEAELVCELFSLLGEASIVDEQMVDAATAVSGSGPAYFALFVEELAKSGVALGLPEALALRLARQTLVGTGSYLALKDISPEELRSAVTSPNGTTEAAIECFEAQNFGLVVRNALEACLRRAKELG